MGIKVDKPSKDAFFYGASRLRLWWSKVEKGQKDLWITLVTLPSQAFSYGESWSHFSFQSCLGSSLLVFCQELELLCGHFAMAWTTLSLSSSRFH